MLKRSVAILAVALVVILAAQPTALAHEFTDIQGHWAADSITSMHEAGIVLGEAGGRVRPDDPISRVEFMALLLRSEDIYTDTVVKSPFVDVPETHWGYKFVAAAKQWGITNGIDSTHFGPADNVTREQAIAMIMRASQSIETGRGPRIAFSDVEESRWSLGYIVDASTAGIIESDGSTTFRPGTPATRAEVITWLSNMLFAETKREYLPADSELIQVVETYERTQAQIINAGYPFNWDPVVDMVTGRTKEDLALLLDAYETGGTQGTKWQFETPTFTDTVIVGKGQHMSAVMTFVGVKVAVTAADGTRSTLETRKKVIYLLRSVDGAWKIYKVGILVDEPAQ